MTDAQSEFSKLYPLTSQKPPQPAQDAQQQAQQLYNDLPSANSPQAPRTPNSAVAGATYTKKDAIAKLNAGDKFKMKVVQIEKHSKDGSDYYEFFEPYGGKAGQFSAVSVFVDNEVAIKNGLIDYLNTFNISMKAPLVGEWILNCAMGKPKTKVVKGEEKTFTNIYVNSFEGQPVSKPPKSSGGYAYDDELDSEFDVM
jgi:hypothetical protein